MTANSMKPVFAAALLLAAFSPIAEAGERHDGKGYGRNHDHQRVENNRWDRQGDGRYNRPAEIDRANSFDNRSITYFRRPDRQPGDLYGRSDFYGGALVAWSLPGHGIYFLNDDGYWPRARSRNDHLAPKAKVIDVKEALNGGKNGQPAACSFEAGVCVIRGGR